MPKYCERAAFLHFLLLCHLKCAVHGATADGLKWLFSTTVVHDKKTVM